MSIMNRFNFKIDKKKIGALSLVFTAASGMIFFQNCGGPLRQANAVRPQYELPYSKQKVSIAQGLFTKTNVSSKMSASSEGASESEARAPKKLKITLLIKNRCALDECRTGDEEKILTCRLAHDNMHEGLQNSFQFYDTELPEAMTQKEIEKWISQNSVDQSCIVGLSEQHMYKKSATFNDTQVSNQAATLSAMTYPAAVDQLKPQTDFNTVRVGIVDTGVEDHADAEPVFKRQDARGSLSKSDPACPATAYQDYYGHGTFVAGIISAKQNNGMGIVGLAPHVSIYSYMIGRCSDSAAPTSEMANAVFLSLDDKVDVINISYGGNTGDDTAFRTALLIALNSGTTIVIAAGNADADVLTPGKTFYPAAYANGYPGIITVAATDNSAVKAKFSNFSATAVKTAAPGVAITSFASTLCKFCNLRFSDAGGSYAVADGTSFSAPIVAAEAAWAIGFLKKYNMDTSPDYIENLVTNFGAVTKANLNTAVKNGRFISFNALATSILKLKPSTDPFAPPTPPSSNISYNYNYIQTASGPSVQLTMTWDLPYVHPGARVGIYDGTCKGTSSACLIVDAALSGPKGSYTFTLNRDQLVPMLADKRDPTYSLNLMMAIHYPIPKAYDKNGKPISFENNHGLDAAKSLNVRDLDGSNGSSQLMGQITNIRTDMQYFYVQGWACFQGSNAVVSVGIEDELGMKIPSYYSYNYSLMTPHGTPLDYQGNFSNFKNLATLPYSKPFMAKTIEIINTSNKTSYPAGLEANPQNVLKCNTVTASHGFELVYPFWQIAQSGLALKNFKVIGTYVNKRDSNKVLTAIIPDKNGRSSYSFPDVNFQTTVKNTFQIDRNGTNNYSIAGSICSDSASPVEVEVSADYADYFAAVFGNNSPISGDPGGIADVRKGNGFVADPNFNDANAVQRYSGTIDLVGSPGRIFTTLESYLTAIETGTFNVSLSSAISFKYEITAELDNEEKKRVDYYITKAAATSPHTFDTQAYIAVSRNFETRFIVDREKLDFATVQRFDAAQAKISAAINAKVKTLNFRQNGTGYALDYYDTITTQLVQHGAQITANDGQNRIDRGLASMQTPYGPFWDYYDVGEAFSNEVIGYKFDIKNPVGAYLKETYKVDQILREVKKYEVPLSTWAVDLGHGHMIHNKAGNPGLCGSKFQHYVNPLDISNRLGYMVDVFYFLTGFWVMGNSPTGVQAIPSTDVIMKRLPLNLRFFQDGKMILHIESDYTQNWGEVRYPFQSVGY